MNITGIKNYWAYFYNDRGEYVGRKSFSQKERTFKYGNRSYNIILKEGTETKFDYFLWERRIYYYNINNPNPIKMDKKAEPILDAEVYNQFLETKVIKDLNDISSGLGQYLTPRNIIIGIIIIGVLIYVGTGHSLLPNTSGQ